MGPPPKNVAHLFEELPWWLGGVAAVLVGGLSAVSGCDVWDCLMRTGIAYAVFWAAGIPLGKFFRATATGQKPKTPSKSIEEPPLDEETLPSEGAGADEVSGDIEE